MKTVLFICTGNYYRSRFAEIYFNYLATKESLNWHADSRGLMVGIARNIGEISPFAVEKLRELEVVLPAPHRFPLQLSEKDLQSADLIIALDGDEHRAMIIRLFPKWLEKIELWSVPDVHLIAPEIALPKIKIEVEDLVLRLRQQANV